MSPHAYLEIIDLNGQVRFHPLDPERGITTIGRHVKNDIVLAEAEVAPFHALLDHRQKPYQLILLAEGENTKLRGQPVPPHTPTTLSPWETLDLAGHIIILCPGEGASEEISSLVALPQHAPPLAERPRDHADDHFLVTLSGREWTVEVEQSAVCQMTITNRQGREAEFIVHLEGLKPAWVSIVPSRLQAGAYRQARVSIVFKPPRLPESRAGAHHLAIVVTSASDPGRFSRLGGTLIIKPYQEFNLGALTPRQQTLSWFTPSGQATMPVMNTGNDQAVFRLEGEEKAGACSFEFQAPGEIASLAKQVEFRLQPGETRYISVRITPRWRQMVRLGKQVHACIITTAMLESQQPSRSVLAQVETAPLLGPGWVTVLTICLAVLVGLAARQISKNTPPDFKLMQKIEELKPRLSSLNIFEPIKATMTPPAENIMAEENSGEMTYEEIFKEIAAAYDLDWRLLAAQAYYESRLNPLAIGQDYEAGLMQLRPSTWNTWAAKVGASNPYDPYSNILVAATYLAFLRDYFSELGYSEEEWMLIAYNWGPANLQQLLEGGGGWADVPATTRRYTLNILQAKETGQLSPTLAEHLQTRVSVAAAKRQQAIKQEAASD